MANRWGGPGFQWTEENTATLRKLWADGRTCSEIARALGGEVSRNAVIGKVHRLGLPERANRRPRVGSVAARWVPGKGGGMRAPSIPKRGKFDPNPGAGNRFRQGLPKPVAPVRAAPAVDEAALERSVSWNDRSPDQCAWILGETNGAQSRCCGQPVSAEGRMSNQASAVYCADHAAAARAPVAAKPVRVPNEVRQRRRPRDGHFFGAGWMS